MTSTSHPELTALQCQVMLLFINPNTKLGLAFKDLEVSVIFDGDHLASKRLPDLFVNSRNRSAISFKLGTVRDNDDVVVKKISEGKAQSFEVDLSPVFTYKTDALACIHTLGHCEVFLLVQKWLGCCQHLVQRLLGGCQHQSQTGLGAAKIRVKQAWEGSITGVKQAWAAAKIRFADPQMPAAGLEMPAAGLEMVAADP
ncbi:hypothetical protein M0R45_029615 [Rubus argutus]|uniref:Uncharacterized protein n=1 Tax=Rubus argutus TaxID=59490 RepID=A0AAW1WB15_RUBAR